MTAERSERLLRWAVAFVWLATGVLVVSPFYRAEGARWLEPLGVGPWLMFITCAAEVALAGYLFRIERTTKAVALLQIAAVSTFTGILGLLEPMLLVHYLGMLTKNLPLLICVWVSWRLGQEGWTAATTRLLRLGMAVIWVTEGVLPKMLFQQPGEVEIAMVLGLSAASAGTLIWVTGLGQALSGLAAMVLRGAPLRWLLLLQLLALIFLPLMVTFVQPQMWVHPFGPLIKNAPILAGTYILWRRCT